MIACSTIKKRDIRSHYNLSTLFYRLLWGRHIHHGLWTADESPSVAQQQLTETLAQEAGILRHDRVLDVGCGMGGSSLYLAKQLGCEVTGITISPLQRRWAQSAACLQRLPKRAKFLCADAELITFPPASFDVVWSVECTEHLFDKPAFFQRSAQWLRPNGRIAICAWLAGDRTDASTVQHVHDVCEGFFCPSLGTQHDYVEWMQQAGFEIRACHDWTSSVTKTWEICRDRVRKFGMHWLARAVDQNSVTFLERFDTILKAYQTGAMKYGCFVAERTR
jgi:tocopherol O-methyltransferase